MSIYKKLQAIQAELVVPKNQFNAFGKYNYRNAEDILAAAKPICHKHGCTLVLSDELVFEGGRYYIKATATLVDNDAADPDKVAAVQIDSLAREEETKKGMDAAQITGSASSYARKYALNGLFCLDDVKDADYNNKHDHGSIAVDPDAVDTEGLIEHEDVAAACACGAVLPPARIDYCNKNMNGEMVCFDCQSKNKKKGAA